MKSYVSGYHFNTQVDASSLRWLNTVFDTYVSFTFFSKTLDPLVAKNGSTQVNNTNFVFFDSQSDVYAVAMLLKSGLFICRKSGRQVFFIICMQQACNDAHSCFNNKLTERSFKAGAYYCYCAYVLRISRYSDFLSVVHTNAGIFLRGLNLCGESRT